MFNRIFFSTILFCFSFFCVMGQSFTPDMDPDTLTPTFEQIYKKIVLCDGRIQGGMDITTSAASITVYWTPKKIVEDVYMKNGDIVITTITPEKITRRVKLQADTEPKEDIYFNLQKQKESRERIARNFTCVPDKKE